MGGDHWAGGKEDHPENPIWLCKGGVQLRVEPSQTPNPEGAYEEGAGDTVTNKTDKHPDPLVLTFWAGHYSNSMRVMKESTC